MTFALLLAVLGSTDGAWRAGCGLEADAGPPDASVCFGSDLCQSRVSDGGRVITCRWHPGLDLPMERSVEVPTTKASTRERWRTDGTLASREQLEGLSVRAATRWYPTGVVESEELDGGARFFSADGCEAVTRASPARGVEQYDFSAEACAGRTGGTRQLRLPHGVARVSVVRALASKPTVRGPGGAELVLSPTSVCLGTRCVKHPKGSLTELANVFWSRDGSWALVRGTQRRFGLRRFPEYVDPPHVLVDLGAQTLTAGHFPLGGDPRRRAGSPCGRKAVSLPLEGGDWLCLTWQQAERRRGATTQRCSSSFPDTSSSIGAGQASFATCSPEEALLFRWQPGPFSASADPACDQVFAGLAVKVPGEGVDWGATSW